MTTHHQHYINGEFVAHQGDRWIEVINPSTEALLSRIPQAVVRMPALPSAPQKWLSLDGKRCLQ